MQREMSSPPSLLNSHTVANHGGGARGLDAASCDETILGVHLEGGRELWIAPRISAEWPECSVRYRVADRRSAYHIHIKTPHAKQLGVSAATLDERPIAVGARGATEPLMSDGLDHHVVIVL
jgi:cellobiose phosphorylase